MTSWYGRKPVCEESKSRQNLKRYRCTSGSIITFRRAYVVLPGLYRVARSAARGRDQVLVSESVFARTRTVLLAKLLHGLLTRRHPRGFRPNERRGAPLGGRLWLHHHTPRGGRLDDHAAMSRGFVVEPSVTTMRKRIFTDNPCDN